MKKAFSYETFVAIRIEILITSGMRETASIGFSVFLFKLATITSVEIVYK